MSGPRAHLVLTFDVSEGLPPFVHAGIFSETAQELTMVGGRNRLLLVDGPEGWGNTYAEAKRDLEQQLADHPYYQWLKGEAIARVPNDRGWEPRKAEPATTDDASDQEGRPW